MHLISRDVEILRFVNEFGYCDIFQLMKRFSYRKTWMYDLVQRLVSNGLLKLETILNSRNYAYCVTTKGARYTELPAIDHVMIGQCLHHDYLIDVFIETRQRYPEATWLCERKLRQEKFCNGIGVKGHISDGMLIFPDGREIAIEVEISVKGKKRIEKIMRWYCTQVSIREVWYFCTPSVISALNKISHKKSFIKIINLEEYFNAK